MENLEQSNSSIYSKARTMDNMDNLDLSNSSIYSKASTVFQRIESLMLSIPTDDKEIFSATCNRIYKELSRQMNMDAYNEIKFSEEFNQYRKECLDHFSNPEMKVWNDELKNLVGKDLGATHISLLVTLNAWIYYDGNIDVENKRLSPYNLALLYNTFFPPMNADRRMNELCNQDFSAKKLSYSEEWECDDIGLRHRVITILFGNISPNFELNMNMNLKTLRTLCPETLISDNIISSFCNLLNKETGSRVVHVFEGSLNCDYLKDWENKTHKQVKRDASKRFEMLFPHGRNTHFTLYRVLIDDADENKLIMKLYDSSSSIVNRKKVTIQSKSRDQKWRYERNMSFIFTRALGFSKHQFRTIELQYQPVPQQSNGYDCGVFCMLYLIFFTESSKKLKMKDICQDYIDRNKIRNWILASILKHKVILP